MTQANKTIFNPLSLHALAENVLCISLTSCSEHYKCVPVVTPYGRYLLPHDIEELKPLLLRLNIGECNIIDIKRSVLNRARGKEVCHKQYCSQKCYELRFHCDGAESSMWRYNTTTTTGQRQI